MTNSSFDSLKKVHSMAAYLVVENIGSSSSFQASFLWHFILYQVKLVFPQAPQQYVINSHLDLGLKIVFDHALHHLHDTSILPTH